MEKELSYFNGKGKGAMSNYFTGMVSFSSLSFYHRKMLKCIDSTQIEKYL